MFEKKKKRKFKLGFVLVALIIFYLIHVVYVVLAHNPSFELLSRNTISYSGLKAKIYSDHTRISYIQVSLGTEEENLYKIYEQSQPNNEFKEKIINVSFRPEDKVVKFIKKNNLKSLYLYYTIDYKNKFFDSKIEKKIKISLDFEPPNIKNIKTDSYVYVGGIGYVIYETSIDTFKSYVDTGLAEKFHPISINKEDTIYNLVFFTCGNRPCKNGVIKIIAEDLSGNSKISSRRMKTLLTKRWQVSNIKVDLNFIKDKYNEIFNAEILSANIDNFIELNKNLRIRNNSEITQNTRAINKDRIPSKRFYQMKNSKVFSGFSEKRNYFFDNPDSPLMSTYHWGYDLASIENANIYSSSDGVVSYLNNGGLGIYGKTILIDHGLGFYTLYSHLSEISVGVGDKVDNNTIIGRSGQTGLAYGDHLHFGTYIQGVPYDSNEIWDYKYFNQKVINIYKSFINQSKDKIIRENGT